MTEKIAVIGLGYVGLPLALGLCEHFTVIGFDISKKRIDELKRHYDWANEHTKEELAKAKIDYTTDENKLKEATFFIVTVPTPVDKANIPDLTPVKKAAETIGKHIQKNAVVVLESTVYPGVTEDIMGDIIEKISGLKKYVDFKLGYSPERINPGDKEHTLQRIVKVVSGQDEETLERVANVYSKACHAGVFKASGIKVAEAAKVIENTQRDINIALMNELAIIFGKIGINTKDVLDAAGTKWNFLKFTPGLVGGHCIGVDPYYLTHLAQQLGHHPQVILSGRRINDSMATYVVDKTIHHLNQQGKPMKNSNILVLGVTFKENVKDCRNSKVADIITELQKRGANVIVHDPMVMEEKELVKHEIGVELTPLEKVKNIDATILAVSHTPYKQTLTTEYIKKLMPHKPIMIDVKSMFNKKELEKHGIVYDAL